MALISHLTATNSNDFSWCVVFVHPPALWTSCRILDFSPFVYFSSTSATLHTQLFLPSASSLTSYERLIYWWCHFPSRTISGTALRYGKRNCAQSLGRLWKPSLIWEWVIERHISYQVIRARDIREYCCFDIPYSSIFWCHFSQWDRYHFFMHCSTCISTSSLPLLPRDTQFLFVWGYFSAMSCAEQIVLVWRILLEQYMERYCTHLVSITRSL